MGPIRGCRSKHQAEIQGRRLVGIRGKKQVEGRTHPLYKKGFQFQILGQEGRIHYTPSHMNP